MPSNAIYASLRHWGRTLLPQKSHHKVYRLGCRNDTVDARGVSALPGRIVHGTGTMGGGERTAKSRNKLVAYIYITKVI